MAYETDEVTINVSEMPEATITGLSTATLKLFFDIKSDERAHERMLEIIKERREKNERTRNVK